MSVDLVATLPRPVPLGVVVDTARAVIARTRLAGPPRDLLSASEAHLRRFPCLGGWPTVSLG